jgi:hypothetical protein
VKEAGIGSADSADEIGKRRFKSAESPEAIMSARLSSTSVLQRSLAKCGSKCFTATVVITFETIVLRSVFPRLFGNSAPLKSLRVYHRPAGILPSIVVLHSIRTSSAVHLLPS